MWMFAALTVFNNDNLNDVDGDITFNMKYIYWNNFHNDE